MINVGVLTFKERKKRRVRGPGADTQAHKRLVRNLCLLSAFKGRECGLCSERQASRQFYCGVKCIKSA